MSNLHDPYEEDWSSPVGFESYHQPFRIPGMDEATREEANKAVRDAIEAYKKQSWWQTARARARSWAWFYMWYYPRFTAAVYLTKLICKLTGKSTRVVSEKVWLRLGV